MVDPLISQAGQVAGQTGAAPAAGPGTAKAEDVSRFQEGLRPEAGAPPMDAQAGQGVSGVQAPDQAQRPNVVEGLDQLSSDLKAARTGIIEGAEHMGEIGALLRTQFEVAQLTTTQTMVGQVGQKTSQGTQQLLKGQ